MAAAAKEYYHHGLRRAAPKRVCWWRSIAVIGVFVPLSVVPILVERPLSNAVDGFFGLAGRTRGQGVTELTPGLLLINNLLMSTTPFFAALSAKLVYGKDVKWSPMISTRRRWRVRRWALPSLAPACASGALFTYALRRLRPSVFGIQTYLSTPVDWALLLIALVTVPIEAAAEEFVFRGFIQQTIASPIASPLRAFWISTLAQSSLFAVIHASPDVWHNVLYLWVGMTNALCTRMTGGIEVASVFHAAYNVALFVPMLLSRDHSLLLDRFELTKSIGAPVALLGMLASGLVPVWTYFNTRCSKYIRKEV